MRISFLCICLEPGEDGVGDYVRQFAQQLTLLGHQCQAVALADRFVATPFAKMESAAPFEIVRIPAKVWATGDTRQAEEALRRFNPDWTSLQMVAYGYESHGLLLRSAAAFERLRHFGMRHMMFHELWIGESTGQGIKKRLLGMAQKQLLLRATKQWDPAVVHTSNPVYRELLARGRIDAAELPLPGNIPVHPVDDTGARQWLLGMPELGNCRDADSLLVGIFGSLHPEWYASSWLGELANQCSNASRPLVVIQLGRAGTHGEAVWGRLQHEFRSRMSFVKLGVRSAEEISRALQGLDCGIATTPWALIGKSGTVAAMLEHGLPVAVTRDDFRLRTGPTPAPAAKQNLFLADTDFCRQLVLRQVERQPARTDPAAYQLLVRAISN